MADPPRRLLLLESGDWLNAVLAEYIQRANHRITRVSSLADCRECLGREGFDLLLLDPDLPDGDGLTLLTELKEQYGLPVFVISQGRNEMCRLRALEDGADGYFTRPFQVRELELQIRNFFRRRPGQAEQQRPPWSLAIGKGSLQIDEYRLVGPGRAAQSLTRTERNVLLALGEARGRVCTRRYLAVCGGGPDEPIGDETVTVVIYRIRKKLRLAGLQDIAIESVSGAGYRLVDAASPA